MTTGLERIANGDESAVREIVDEFGGLIHRLARRYLDKVESEIDDAVQDVFVEIWLSAKRYDPNKGTEASFIATLAHRRLIDAQRRAVTRHKNARASAHTLHPGEPIAPIRAAVRTAVLEDVAQRFDELPDDERQPLWLAIHRGLTHNQIAEVLDTPVGTVKTRLRRAVMRMGKKLQETQGAPPMTTEQKGGES